MSVGSGPGKVVSEGVSVTSGIGESMSSVARLARDMKRPEASRGLFPFWGMW